MSLRRFILAIQSNRHLFSREAYVKRWLCSATLAPDRATQMANPSISGSTVTPTG